MLRRDCHKSASSAGVNWLLAAAVMLACSRACMAQATATGRIAGVVKDASNAVMAGATVTATNRATGQSRSTTTNAEGGFIISNLIPGTYDVTFEAQGFEQVVRQGVVV